MFNQEIINDSKLIQTYKEDFEDISDEQIKELLNSEGKVNWLLVEKFYKNETIQENELFELFHSLNYLDCSRITELYYKIFDSNVYDEINFEVKHEINKCIKIFKQIACGNFHSVGIRHDNTIITWGCNFKGEYDNSPSGRFKQIACGGSHSVGIREDGTVVTWGSNSWNQYDNSPSGKIIQVACGDSHSVGIREDGTVVTWGSNHRNQYYNSPSGKFIQIACGDYHSLGIREDLTLAIWGYNINSNTDNYSHVPEGKFIQIGCGSEYFSIGLREDGTVICFGRCLMGKHITQPLGRFIKISCGTYYSVCIKEDDTVVTVQNDNLMNCCSPPNKFIDVKSFYHIVGITIDKHIVVWGGGETYYSRKYIPFEKIIDIACGYDYTVGIKEDGTIVTWGEKNRNQLHNSPDKKYVQIACGDNYAICIDEYGCLSSFGNIYGMIHYHNYYQSYLQTYDHKLKQVACGISHSVGIIEDGTVVTWGDHFSNQHNNSPSGEFIQVACGGYYSVGIRDDGTIAIWGDDIYCKHYYPPEGKFTQIACGKYHSVGIREDETIECWGSNPEIYDYDNYECFCSSDEFHNNIIFEKNPSGKFIQIACGDRHSVGIREDGSVVTWGCNLDGQYNNSPSGKFIKIACSSKGSIGIKKDGSVVAWGNFEL